MVRLVQNLVTLGTQGELKGDLRLASGNPASFCHLDVGVDQLNGLLRSTWAEEVKTTTKHFEYKLYWCTSYFIWVGSYFSNLSLSHFPTTSCILSVTMKPMCQISPWRSCRRPRRRPRSWSWAGGWPRPPWWGRCPGVGPPLCWPALPHPQGPPVEKTIQDIVLDPFCQVYQKVKLEELRFWCAVHWHVGDKKNMEIHQSRYTNPIITCSLQKAVLKHFGDCLNHQSILITTIMITIMQNLRDINFIVNIW